MGFGHIGGRDCTNSDVSAFLVRICSTIKRFTKQLPACSNLSSNSLDKAMSDWLPGVSQLKSAIQLLCGDAEGAKKTQENFSRQCPVVSQLRSTIELANGDATAALQTQKEFLATVNEVANQVPIVGHVKGMVHYAMGDNDGGDNAMKSSSRTVGVLAGGAGGGFVGGPVGAIVGGIKGGLIMDGVTTAVDSRIHGHYRPTGYIEQFHEIKKDPTNSGLWFDTAVSGVLDGWTGLGEHANNSTKLKDKRNKVIYQSPPISEEPREIKSNLYNRKFTGSDSITDVKIDDDTDNIAASIVGIGTGAVAVLALNK
ncbi:hypothetical protein LOTGIDRAFT_238932 [Lottia gigantea]|uniref:Uncharacterized protein n=1 Tax=Lottia gigantea TaxID=225164 RepID=V4CB42_LOTGI|nr:hypothetical protein LOTGIDRAFT_238932 [Lottia gigantea]ESO99054.1 hypothetical protein LOTGIDRAFT_238932 [Lottia gigantea]